MYVYPTFYFLMKIGKSENKHAIITPPSKIYIRPSYVYRRTILKTRIAS